MQKSRDVFIDIVKIYACALVVLGHFFQSMTLSGIISQTAFTDWFNQTIYYFHVPLFFICSGYLYQKYSKVNSFAQWKNNVLKKMLALGIPYVVFSTVTWVLKSAFTSSVNSEVDGYFTTLFCKPLSPYWYLYALFFVFLITTTFGSRKSALAALSVALVLKCVSFVLADCNVFVLTSVLSNEVWFVIGMCLCICNTPEKIREKKCMPIAVLLSIAFVLGSIVISLLKAGYAPVSFVMGVIACIATLIFAIKVEKNTLVCKITCACAVYTMPVFLMHTIFAASLRALLFKISINSAVVHIVLGILISFIGPVVAAVIMSKVKWLDFLLYPNKYVKIKKEEK